MPQGKGRCRSSARRHLINCNQPTPSAARGGTHDEKRSRIRELTRASAARGVDCEVTMARARKTAEEHTAHEPVEQAHLSDRHRSLTSRPGGVCLDFFHEL